MEQLVLWLENATGSAIGCTTLRILTRTQSNIRGVMKTRTAWPVMDRQQHGNRSKAIRPLLKSFQGIGSPASDAMDRPILCQVKGGSARVGGERNGRARKETDERSGSQAEARRTERNVLDTRSARAGGKLYGAGLNLHPPVPLEWLRGVEYGIGYVYRDSACRV